jgi:hypothetical protein
MLLLKVPISLKPFLPQLQRTFCKSLSDNQSDLKLREEASICLSLLIPLQARLEPLILELVQSIKTLDDLEILDSVWKGLSSVLNEIGPDRQISLASLESVHKIIVESLFTSVKDSLPLRKITSKCFGLIVNYISEEEKIKLIKFINYNNSELLKHNDNEPRIIHCKLLAINEIVAKYFMILDLEYWSNFVISHLESHEEAIAECAVKLSYTLITVDKTKVDFFLPVLIKVMQTGSENVRIVVINVINTLSALLALKSLVDIVPALMGCIRDRYLPIKFAAETCLIAVLKMNGANKTFEEYLKTLEKSKANIFSEFAKKVYDKNLVDQ